MENKKKKAQKWEKIKSKFSHLENNCEIKVKGLEDNSIYFHPVLVLDELTSITSQSDVNSDNAYAYKFNHDNRIIVDISYDLTDNIVIGWTTNKDVVLEAFETLNKVRGHIQKIECYTNDYINNLLIGNSIKELSDSFINEIKTATKVVEVMQNKKK